MHQRNTKGKLDVYNDSFGLRVNGDSVEIYSEDDGIYHICFKFHRDSTPALMWVLLQAQQRGLICKQKEN